MGWFSWFKSKEDIKKAELTKGVSDTPQVNEPHTPKRSNFLMAFIGTNRTGKSSIARMVADEWKKSRDENDIKKYGKRKHVVVSFDPQDRFKDISDYRIRPDDKDWAKKLLKLRNALIILDDYRIINQINVPVAGFADLLAYRAAYNFDIIYICHSPSLVLNYLTYYTTHYYIFYTQATEGRFSDKIPNYALCMNGSQLVNKYVTMYGKGAHPKSPEFKGQAFPYGIINTEEATLKFYNIREEFIESFKKQRSTPKK